MTEYIDRQALEVALNHRLSYLIKEYSVFDHYTTGYSDAVFAVEGFPSADAVPVVRCKDCKYYRNHPNGLCYLHTEPTENERGYSGEAVCVEPDDFCSYGEQREE